MKQFLALVVTASTAVAFLTEETMYMLGANGVWRGLHREVKILRVLVLTFLVERGVKAVAMCATSPWKSN